MSVETKQMLLTNSIYWEYCILTKQAEPKRIKKKCMQYVQEYMHVSVRCGGSRKENAEHMAQVVWKSNNHTKT